MQLMIGNKQIGPACPTFFIAELSANHLQKFDLACDTIRAMKASGADAVKLQTYTPDTMTVDSDQDWFMVKQGTVWDGRSLYNLYQEAYTPWEWHKELMALANSLGMECFSSPFDISAVDFLAGLNVPAYKVASFEITDIPLIEHIASKGKPVIISTGIATLVDIEEAVAACKRQNNHQIALLKCTSAYPAPLEDVNLRTIPNLADTFGTVVGLSDHTLGITVPIGAVTLGARIVEKHFILERKLGGVDSGFSLEPAEFKQMVDSVRDIEKALGRISYDLTEKTRKSREFSRTLFVVKDMAEGEIFSSENMKPIRPGFGLAPKFQPQILGKRARTAIRKGTPLSWDLIS